MAPKLTAQQLLDRLAQNKEDALTFKELWTGYLAEIPLPPDHEIMNAVRRLGLQDLSDGMESYQSKISQIEGKATSRNAMNYICGTAWKILEKENPDQEFHPTARRIRNAKRDPDSADWNGEAFHNATPAERQRIMAETIAQQKRKSQ